MEDAVFLSRMCEKVYLIHRRDEFRGAKILQNQVKNNDKIEILWNSVVTKIDGDSKVESIQIENVDSHVDKTLDVDGIFIAVGTKPVSDLLKAVWTWMTRAISKPEKTESRICREFLQVGTDERKICVRW